jgi:hypothetical protein
MAALGSQRSRFCTCWVQGAVSKCDFVAAAMRELSVFSFKGNYLMHRALLGVLAGVAGRGFCVECV